MKKLMIMGALPVLAMATPQVAMADETKTAYASYAGLDLTTQAGQEELKDRIQRAALAICADKNERVSATEASRRSACMKVALQKSEQQYASAVGNARYGG